MDGESVLNIAIGVSLGLAVAVIVPLVFVMPFYYVAMRYEKRRLRNRMERLASARARERLATNSKVRFYDS